MNAFVGIAQGGREEGWVLDGRCYSNSAAPGCGAAAKALPYIPEKWDICVHSSGIH